MEYSDDGKKIAETEELVPVMDEVHIPADTNAQKFWLQHRKPEDWGKAVEELNSEEEGGVVEIPGIDWEDTSSTASGPPSPRGEGLNGVTKYE